MPPFFNQLKQALNTPLLSGLNSGAASATVAQILKQNLTHGHLWLIAPDERSAELIFEDLKLWSSFWRLDEWSILFYPDDDIKALQGDSPNPMFPRQRIQTLYQRYTQPQSLVVSSLSAAILKSISATQLLSNTIVLEKGSCLDPEQLENQLVESGYQPKSLYDEGDFDRRNEVVRLWPIGKKTPYRVVFFDDEIEDIHSLDEHGRPNHQEKSLTILPAKEAIINKNSIIRLKRYFNQTSRSLKNENNETFKNFRFQSKQILKDLEAGYSFIGHEDYLPVLWDLQAPIQSSNQIILFEPEQIWEQLKTLHSKRASRWNILDPAARPLMDPVRRFLDRSGLLEQLNGAIQIGEAVADGMHIKMGHGYDLRMKDQRLFWDRMRLWTELGWTLVLFSSSLSKMAYFENLLQLQNIPHQRRSDESSIRSGEISLFLGHLSKGFFDGLTQIAYLSIEELLSVTTIKSRSKKSLNDLSFKSFKELSDGDYVVHERHGIGIFIKMMYLNVGGVDRECLELQYKDGDLLRVPVTMLHKISRYQMNQQVAPRLDKLGSKGWERRLNKAREKTLAIAHDLMRLEATRAVLKGHQYTLDNVDIARSYMSFCADFPYDLTPDQDRSIEDIFNDLQSAKPMDRLLVGDVGFGKTEVAMRAAARVVLEGHQVALLCPTTILSLQHHQTFEQRFSRLGIKVGLFSRLQDAAVLKKMKKQLQSGEIQIAIGTHSLLGSTIRFKRLGLVVVDEEHRFGVKQKEKIKRVSQQNPIAPAEYLAMSATPIPRSLHMALSGLRDVSIIATPPADRQSVETTIMRHSEGKIQNMLERELKRGGQAFFLHNRIQTLQTTAKRLQELLPNAKIQIAHGQMKRAVLEETILGFMKRKFQILVCTSIIENGIDLPNVNTIMIDNAHMMGLAQLYQLRGRVGRSSRRGFCALLIPPHGLPKEALSRISALQRYTDLGAGFSIATADLELRGSGNLLGKEQSGHIEAIGLMAYIKLMEEAVATAKGMANQRLFDPEIQLAVSACLPESFISDAATRLTEYRHLSEVKSISELRSLMDRWELSYGDLPNEALNLGWMSEIRLLCFLFGVEKVLWKKSHIHLILHPTSIITEKMMLKLQDDQTERFSVEIQDIYSIFVQFSEEESLHPFSFLHWIFEQFRSYS